jgi:hypothetical protein
MSSTDSTASIIQHIIYESDDDSHASAPTLDSAQLLGPVQHTLFIAAPTASEPDELSSNTLSSFLEANALLQEHASVECRGADYSSQTSSVVSSLCWENL